ATLKAHVSGGVPNMVIDLPELDAYTFGYLVYFFKKACAMSGYLLDVNPFDQPGVEAYKNNMFEMLGKFESEKMKCFSKDIPQKKTLVYLTPTSFSLPNKSSILSFSAPNRLNATLA